MAGLSRPLTASVTAVARRVAVESVEQAQRVTVYPVGEHREDLLVRAWSAGRLEKDPDWHYVICHGMWGTKSGDRYYRLATAIKRRFPRANVIMLDWSKASKKGFGPHPIPWMVAKSIDPVAKKAAPVLKAHGVDPLLATFIGESFGNYVLAGMANHLGGADRVLAMNPAHELGGYAPPNLQSCFKQAWTFHTNSMYDTWLERGHRSLFLETPVGASNMTMHMYGINWLAARLNGDDESWLTMRHKLPEPRPGVFACVASRHGCLVRVAIARVKDPAARANEKEKAAATPAAGPKRPGTDQSATRVPARRPQIATHALGA